MVMKIHSDASDHNKDNISSNHVGFFFLGDNQESKKPTKLNGTILSNITVLKMIATFAVETTVKALVHNEQMTTELCLAL